MRCAYVTFSFFFLLFIFSGISCKNNLASLLNTHAVAIVIRSNRKFIAISEKPKY